MHTKLLLTFTSLFTLFHQQSFAMYTDKEEDKNKSQVTKKLSFQDKKPQEWLELADKENNPTAQNFVGFMYKYGIGVDQNYNEAFRRFILSANKNYPLGHYNAALMTYYGQFEMVDKVQAYHHFSEAKKLISLKRQNYESLDSSESFILGSIHYYGFIKSYDLTLAHELFTEASEQGNPSAQAFLSKLHKEEDGKFKDLVKSLKLATKAADAKNAWGQYCLGLMYLSGEGATQNDEMAVTYLTLAARQNHQDATYVLMWMAANNRIINNTKHDSVFEESLNSLFHKGKNLGVHDALYSIGRMYEYGYGVEKNLTNALQYYTAGAKAGNKFAKKKIKNK